MSSEKYKREKYLNILDEIFHHQKITTFYGVLKLIGEYTKKKYPSYAPDTNKMALESIEKVLRNDKLKYNTMKDKYNEILRGFQEHRMLLHYYRWYISQVIAKRFDEITKLNDVIEKMRRQVKIVSKDIGRLGPISESSTPSADFEVFRKKEEKMIKSALQNCIDDKKIFEVTSASLEKRLRLVTDYRLFFERQLD